MTEAYLHVEIPVIVLGSSILVDFIYGRPQMCFIWMENQYCKFETATTDFPDVISKMKSHCPMKSISTHGTRGFLKRELAPPAPMGGRTKRGAISNFPSPADAYDVTRSRRQGFLMLFIGIVLHNCNYCGAD